MAVGRAPVVTDCGGLPDSVRGLDPSLIVAGGGFKAGHVHGTTDDVGTSTITSTPSRSYHCRAMFEPTSGLLR